MRLPRVRRSLTCLALVGASLPALAHADEPPSWVFFTDRGHEPSTLSLALAQRTHELAPRALRRRQRVRGDAGVDARDLPPATTYVDAVLATGATLRHQSRWLNAISVEATPAQRAAIAALPAVARVQPVARRSQLEDPRTHARLPPAARSLHADEDMYGFAWPQLSVLSVPFLHDCGLTGEGVVIGVQDSGFLLEHPALQGVNVIAARDFVKNDDIVADEPGDADGQDDHGTMVLSTIAGSDPGRYLGAAPGVSVLLSKTEDIGIEEPFEEDNYVAGLEWLEMSGADLFTASLGYIDWYEQSDFDGKTAVTTIAADIAVAQGLIMFNSIGNTGPGPTTMGAPSDAEGVISVGAVTLDGVVTEFSSRGPTADGRIKPNIVAPGFNVAVAHPNNPEEYVAAQGTSFAGPLAAGTAALLLQAFPDATPAQMREMLQDAGSRADAPDNDYGWGVPDASHPVFLMCTCTDADSDGHYAIDCGGDDCDDTSPVVHPGAAEICDGRDTNCDTLLPPDELDADGDGALACDDCDDADPAISPDHDEICDDGLDNNCDQQIDTPCDADDSPTGEDSSATSAPDSETDPGDDDPEGACTCASGDARPLLLLLPLALLRRRRHQPR